MKLILSTKENRKKEKEEKINEGKSRQLKKYYRDEIEYIGKKISILQSVIGQNITPKTKSVCARVLV